MNPARQKILSASEHTIVALRWLSLIIPLGLIVGSACALALWSVEQVGLLRFQHPWLLFLLPVAGLCIGLLFHNYDRSSEKRAALVTEQIHLPGGGVPYQTAPLVFLGTCITHLCGGSAGREGVVIQFGGSIAVAFSRCFKLRPGELRVLLTAGIAAGFGAVFGAPVAGAVFALEILSIRRVEYEAVFPALIASVAGYWSCHAWGSSHTIYSLLPALNEAASSNALFQVDLWLLLEVILASVAFGLAAPIFLASAKGLSAFFRRVIPFGPMRPFVGGAIVLGLSLLVGTSDYQGLGVYSPVNDATTIASFFASPHANQWSWFWKATFTAVTLGSGFKGGEITPLLFIGAALGNVLSGVLGTPTDLFAALGLVAVFASATKTPLASAVLGVELFGATHVTYIAAACFSAFLVGEHLLMPRHQASGPISNANISNS